MTHTYPTVTVHNLATGDETVFVGLSPAEAVAAAHGASLGDHNALGYAALYLPLVQYGKHSVGLGDHAARIA